MVLEESPELVTVLKNGELKEGSNAEGKNASIVLRFPENTKKLYVRYGISFIDDKQAEQNLRIGDGK